MTTSTLAKIGTALLAFMMLASCANTIRGVGRDAASAVDATEAAGRNVARAAN